MTKSLKRKNMKYTLGLLSLLLLLWAYIYPSHPFPGGADAHAYQRLANTFIYYGNFKYFLHPFSIWGLYPFSQVPGTSILLASGMLLTRINQLNIVMFFNYILGTLATVSMFAILLRIKRNFCFVMVGSFTFMIAPNIVGFLRFSAEARGFFIHLTPFLFLLTIMYLQNRYRNPLKYLILIMVTFFSLSLIHKNFLFLIAIIFATGIILIVDARRIKPKINRMKHLKLTTVFNSIYIKAFFWVFLFAIISYSVFSFAEKIPTIRFDPSAYEDGFIAGEGKFTRIVNMYISMGAGAGIGAILFGFLGIVVATSVKRKRSVELLFLSSLLLSIPFMVGREYFRPIFVIYLSIFAGYGFLWFSKRKIPLKRTLVTIAVVFLIVSSIFFTNFMVSRWERDIPQYIAKKSRIENRELNYHMSFETYGAGVYQRHNFVRDEKYASFKMSGFESSYLQVVTSQARYGDWHSIGEIERIAAQEDFVVSRRDEFNFPYLYKTDPSFYHYYTNFFRNNIDHMERLAVEHNITMVQTHPKEESSIIDVFYNNKYKTYENEENIFWRF